MRGRAPGDLTVPQLRALLHVRRRPGEGLSPLADHLGMSAPAASALVDRLVRAGLVDRAADPAERRRIQLRLTAEGSEQVARSHLAVRSWLRDELAHLTPAELEQLAGALEVLDGLAKDRR
jgi:DNA-binding MarR family transcriptional regulator